MDENSEKLKSIRLLLPLIFYALFTYILIDISLSLLPGAFSNESYKITFHLPPTQEPTLRDILEDL